MEEVILVNYFIIKFYAKGIVQCAREENMSFILDVVQLALYKFSNAQESLGKYVSLFQCKDYDSPNKVY